MYKITIERLDAQVQIQTQLVYLSNEEAKIIEASGVKIEDRLSSSFGDDVDLQKRPKKAHIPILDTRRVNEAKVYEQLFETLDVKKLIAVANQQIEQPTAFEYNLSSERKPDPVMRETQILPHNPF